MKLFNSLLYSDALILMPLAIMFMCQQHVDIACGALRYLRDVHSPLLLPPEGLISTLRELSRPPNVILQ